MSPEQQEILLNWEARFNSLVSEGFNTLPTQILHFHLAYQTAQAMDSLLQGARVAAQMKQEQGDTNGNPNN